jgi:hypothetical protein
MGFKGIDNWVATDATINGDKVIKGTMMMVLQSSFMLKVKKALA